MTDPDGAAPIGAGGSELVAALDAVIERFGSGGHQAEAARARVEYGERTGRVFEDDELFESRTRAFLEWYAIERPLEGAGEPPVVLALREAEGRTAELLRAWATSHRSLFVVEELLEGRVELVDLVGGGAFAVAERRRLFGVGPGEVVEARLIGWHGEVLFGRTFLYHPAEARPAIEAHVRRIRAAGGSRADVVDFVATLRVRAERYQHVPPERVYQSTQPPGREEA